MTKTKNSGTVLDVQVIDGFFDQHKQYVRYHRNRESIIVGYSADGTPNVKESEVGMYSVTLKDQEGKLRTTKFYGKKPELGSQLIFQPTGDEEKPDIWKEHGAYLQSLLTSPSLSDRIRYAGILDKTVL
ncbi:hypothetical protein HYX19_04900 [Candidatus Woesearchaeota archaeon]|nr:hypothetical protein [Candidatus Woesearchaeota archaeon]